MAKTTLADPDMQQRFLCALDATRVIAVAAKTMGITVNSVTSARYRYPEFTAAIAAVLARPLPLTHASRRFTPWQRQAFLDALRASGCATAAARKSGVVTQTAYDLKRRDIRFAAAWSDARDEARDRAYGRLLDAAITGFVKTETSGDVVKRTVSHEPRAVMAMLDRHRGKAGEARYRTIELTPELGRRARDSLVRKLIAGGGLKTMPEAISDAANHPLTTHAA